METMKKKPPVTAGDRRRELERELQKAGERGVEVMGPGNMSEEERKLIEQMMEMDKGQQMKPKGYKKGGMVTRGQGCVSRKKSCKMC